MKNDLCIPVYLNEKIVYDLLAIVEDGFSKVRAVTDNNTSNTRENENIEAKINTSNILSTFMGISLSGGKGKATDINDSTVITEERIHTASSLFSKLRRILSDDEVLKVIEKTDLDISKYLPGDFVEFGGQISKNPMVETLETFVDVFSTFMKFEEEPELGNKNNRRKQKNENNTLMEQMNVLLSDFSKGDTVDLIISDENENLKLILPTKSEYYVNSLESELLDGSYKVLGKVIRVIENDESINLFRKSSFKIFEDIILNEMIDGMNESISGDEDFSMPHIVSKLNGPIIVVIPIAIYA
jgi:hypothetical protein